MLPHLTVAIGASAGGLTAFTAFLDHLPPDNGMAFVLVQHLDPIHKSLLVGLLAPHTAMAVVEAADRMPLVPGTIFVIPPDATMTVADGRLAVVHPAPPRPRRWPIDSCFASLAADQGPHAVCIILSGTGSDGSHELAAVKGAGGLVLAQAGEDGHAMAGMPRSAVATGCVDAVLPVEAMPERLLTYRQALPLAAAGGARTSDPSHLDDIWALLRERTGNDFSHYKRPTLLRRIHRRMQALNLPDVPALVERLRADPQQIDQLFHTLLIGVTQFMRDPASFQFVAETALPALLTGRRPGEQLRIWVPGCASGEEVYSLAILVQEAMQRLGVSMKVQIFGTDLDATAIATARAGSYPRTALARLSPEQRAAWFVEDGGSCRPIGTIRDMCMFSVHNLIADPPFSKLDLISCRNLLIYLDNELQTQVVQTFHYALNPGGWLFLGPSEGVARGGGRFVQVDKRYRVYRRQDIGADAGGGPATSPALLPSPGPPPGSTRPWFGPEDTIDAAARQALEPYSPAYLIINRAREIVRFSGGAVARYLEPSPGIASLSLFAILRRPLRRTVRTAVQQAMSERETVVKPDLVLNVDRHVHAVTLIVQPIVDRRSQRDFYVVAFLDTDLLRDKTDRDARAAAKTDEATADDDSAATRELAAARSQLLATITDLESANEELKSFNEEYQSTNEELQATNEELETAKEEMQSVNEELQTVNTELMSKNELLAKANNDFQNLLDSTQIATVFLDTDLRIRRFTPPIKALFNLREGDLGRPITDITSRLAYAALPSDLAGVLGGRGGVEREVRLADHAATFLMQMRPYRTADDRIDGAVITFVDISEQSRLQAAETLRTINETLEHRVVERTAELEAVNRELMRQTEERQRAEEMLRHSQKLEAVGKLTGGIAHDFNNLLGVIIGNVEFLLSEPLAMPERSAQLQEILTSALGGAQLTRRLLAFAARQPLQPQLVDLNALLTGQVSMLRRMLGDTIHVVTRLAPDLGLANADPSQIGDALLNLALNARDAMPLGGELTIETSNTRSIGHDADKADKQEAGAYVMLAVTDTGAGMTPEVIERATEPFFTTKSATMGSGLGLSMIYGFARQSGGHLMIESEIGVGTTIRLYLPLAKEAVAPADDVVQQETHDPGGNEAILLVDDNPVLRGVTERQLTTLGYRVAVAGDGPSALTMLRTDAVFDLLVTDVVMPGGLSGPELAQAARALRPGLKRLFITGYAEDVAGAVAGQQVLHKPYRRRELAEAVRAVLDAAPLPEPAA